MLIYCSNLLFFLYSQPLLYRFVDTVHEAPLSGQRQPRSVVGGTLYCILLASEYLLAFLCFLNSDRPCYFFVSCQRDYLRSSFTLEFIHGTMCILYLLVPLIPLIVVLVFRFLQFLIIVIHSIFCRQVMLVLPQQLHGYLSLYQTSSFRCYAPAMFSF